MKVLLVTSHFYPENFKANDMAFDLVKRGYEVTVLAPIPDYPEGKYYKGYGIFKRRHEYVRGVEIIRTFVTPRRDGSSKWLILNYLTHTLFSTVRALWLGVRRKFDVVIVHETSPVMVGIPGMLVKRIQKIPMLFWVLDLWPESVTAASGITSKKILGPLRKLTNMLYRNSDRILISSKGFRTSINSMGNYDDKIEFFPNWVDEVLGEDCNAPIPELPPGFNVLFAGNIGEAQDIPHILEAAELLKTQGINFIFVGDGRKKEWAEDYCKKHNLDNVYFLGRYPLEYMPSFFEKADILLLALKDEPIFKLTVPAKLQAYMSAAKPIVAMINGEGSEVVEEAECGWTVEAENGKKLAKTLFRISTLPKNELRQRGEKGKIYSGKYYSLEGCMIHLVDVLNKFMNRPCRH